MGFVRYGMNVEGGTMWLFGEERILDENMAFVVFVWIIVVTRIRLKIT